MRTFTTAQRVRVVTGPLAGQCGTVARVRLADAGAWVNMDNGGTGDAFPFADEGDHRARWVLLWPDQCEPQAAKP